MASHYFEVEDAERFGILPAVLLTNIRYWVSKNAANEKHFYDGEYWTYNSVQAFSALFPYATTKQIRKALDDLVSFGEIKTGCFNVNPYDRTKWFSCRIDLPHRANDNAPQGKSLSTDINTDVNNGDLKFNPLNVQLPALLSHSVWCDWMAYRKSRKLSTVERTVKSQLKMLAEAGEKANEIVEQSIRNGWNGLFALKSQTMQNQKDASQAAARATFAKAGMLGGFNNERIINE